MVNLKINRVDPIWKKRSAEAMDLIDRCLTLDPDNRITGAQALEHPFIKIKAVDSFDAKATEMAFKNLKAFRVLKSILIYNIQSEQKLQQAALTFIVCNLSTKKEQEELYKTFKSMDKNGDGKITKEELLQGYKEIYTAKSEEELKEEVNKFFTQADFDNNGELDYSEWQVATINKRSILQEEKLKGAFQLFDRDGSGSINAGEIKTILGVGKKFGSEKIWDDIINEVDANGDGEISYDEFRVMMHKFLGETLS